jgi:GTPase SAR1 family protein
MKIYAQHMFVPHSPHRSALLIHRIQTSGDVGGQRTLRPYWRNYFEQTDALVWVVDSGDRLRMKDCKDELHSLLQEDVCYFQINVTFDLL